MIEAVAGSTGDLGMFALDGGPRAEAWWTRLLPRNAPKVIARLPFVERTDHPAGMPVFVISRPLADGGARDIVLEAVRVDRWRLDYPFALATIGAEIVASAADSVGLGLLIGRPGGLDSDLTSSALRGVGAADVRSVEIGSHAARFDASALRPSGA